MRDAQHPPLEEYLEAIFELGEESVAPIQARLVERLGHAAPSVSEMIGRLESDGWVRREGRTIGLTKKGEQLARTVVRRHRLAERLLTDVLGLPWHKAHMEACRWEHVISEEVEARLVAVLGNPATCPHGNPIPGVAQTERDVVAMTEVTVGSKMRVDRVTERIEADAPSLEYLGVNGVVPGATATLRRRDDDGTIALTIGRRRVAVTALLARDIYVEAI